MFFITGVVSSLFRPYMQVKELEEPLNSALSYNQYEDSGQRIKTIKEYDSFTYTIGAPSKVTAIHYFHSSNNERVTLTFYRPHEPQIGSFVTDHGSEFNVYHKEHVVLQSSIKHRPEMHKLIMPDDEHCHYQVEPKFVDQLTAKFLNVCNDTHTQSLHPQTFAKCRKYFNEHPEIESFQLIDGTVISRIPCTSSSEKEHTEINKELLPVIDIQ